MTRTLAGKTILVSGGSRGIGLAIALRAARDGASIVLLAKTATPHPKLEGTIYTAAEQVEAAGGRAVPVVGDLRADEDVERAVGEAVTTFGGIDTVVNNASAIDLSPTLKISMKRYDLLQDVNARGTFALTRAALPYLEAAANPHWPRPLSPRRSSTRWREAAVQKARTPDIMADAAHAILTRVSAPAPATSTPTRTCCAKKASLTSPATASATAKKTLTPTSSCPTHRCLSGPDRRRRQPCQAGPGESSRPTVIRAALLSSTLAGQ